LWAGFLCHRGVVQKVLGVIEEAMDSAQSLAPAERGTAVREYEQKGENKVIKYKCWWYLRDYDQRGKTRDEVFKKISTRLAAEDLTGTEVALS
jgi:hypothetical protein